MRDLASVPVPLPWDLLWGCQGQAAGAGPVCGGGLCFLLGSWTLFPTVLSSTPWNPAVLAPCTVEVNGSGQGCSFVFSLKDLCHAMGTNLTQHPAHSCVVGKLLGWAEHPPSLCTGCWGSMQTKQLPLCSGAGRVRAEMLGTQTRKLWSLLPHLPPTPTHVWAPRQGT